MTLYQINPSKPILPMYDGYCQGDIFQNTVLFGKIDQAEIFRTAVKVLTSSILCVFPKSYKYIEADEPNIDYTLSNIPIDFPEFSQESFTYGRIDEFDYESLFGSGEPDIVFSSKYPTVTVVGKVEHGVRSVMTTDPEDEFWLD